MRTTGTRLTLTALLLLGAAALAPAQEPDPTVRRVLAGWSKRQAMVATIKYQVKGERVLPAGSLRDALGNPLPPAASDKDIRCPLTFVYLLDFSSGRHRLETDETVYSQGKQDYRRDAGTQAHNGKDIRGFTSADVASGQPVISVVRGNMAGVPIEARYWPILLGHGLFGSLADPLLPGVLRKECKPDGWEARGKTVHDGRPCTVLRNEPVKLSTVSYDEVWVDEARDFAIVRLIQYSGKFPFNDYQISYTKAPAGWFVDRWTLTHYSGSRTAIVEKCVVTDRAVDVPVTAADFAIEPAPGQVVRVTNFEETANPLVRPEAQSRELVADETGSLEEALNGEGRSWWKIALYFAVPLCLTVVILAWRKKRNAVKA